MSRADALPVKGDSDRLKQMLLTLIDNAVRYSQSGDTVRIYVRCIDMMALSWRW